MTHNELRINWARGSERRRQALENRGVASIKSRAMLGVRTDRVTVLGFFLLLQNLKFYELMLNLI